MLLSDLLQVMLPFGTVAKFIMRLFFSASFGGPLQVCSWYLLGVGQPRRHILTIDRRAFASSERLGVLNLMQFQISSATEEVHGENIHACYDMQTVHLDYHERRLHTATWRPCG